jgi:hypothetical protein
MRTPSFSLRISIFITAATPAEAPAAKCEPRRYVAAAGSTFSEEDVIGAGRVAVTSRDEFSDVSAH